MNSVSDRLKNKIELAKPSMQEAANALWNADDAREIYPLYLEQMHMVVLAVAGSKLRVEIGADLGEDAPELFDGRAVEQVLRGVPGIAFTHFDAEDVVRHPLVARIVNAYERRGERAGAA